VGAPSKKSSLNVRISFDAMIHGPKENMMGWGLFEKGFQDMEWRKLS